MGGQSPRYKEASSELDFVLLDHAGQTPTRRQSMASSATAEACDLWPVPIILGAVVVTLKLFDDNGLLRELLETRGESGVLVIDGGGSMRCALIVGTLAQLARNMGWAGIVVNGCVRDVDDINACDIGVRASASHPRKPNKKGIGER
ncbi:hypothetical protein RJ639_008350 [Escallonia herrerae]|uniref:4-hydroxy-4-methyl-2-oxoglutarate aldolase n=1 Tax=Escallonia herrerae TaxID=1293975 RepID=A0AA88VSY9_9ASTE|nr:hypothetical protein RJ639_008350 [Escallonia herrerae]